MDIGEDLSFGAPPLWVTSSNPHPPPANVSSYPADTEVPSFGARRCAPSAGRVVAAKRQWLSEVLGHTSRLVPVVISPPPRERVEPHPTQATGASFISVLFAE